MKLKNYKQLFEKKYDGPDDDDDDLFGRPHYSVSDSYEELKKKFNQRFGEKFDDGPDDDDDEEMEDNYDEDAMDNLLYLLRTLFKNSGVEADISNKGLDISISVVLNKKEKMSSIVKVFDVAKKLKKDILPQYDSEFELWETKTDDPMLTFNFYYEGDDGDPNHDGTKPFDKSDGVKLKGYSSDDDDDPFK